MRRSLLDGVRVCSTPLANRLVDEIRVDLVPVLLGEGIPSSPTSYSSSESSGRYGRCGTWKWISENVMFPLA